MRCGDLERYLEAYLDGRLSRGRRTVLRRHLVLCSGCQARVERLRQFERETQARFRALEEPVSVWEGLALDLVGSQESVGEGRLLALTRPSVPRPFAARPPTQFELPRLSDRSPRPRMRPSRATASRVAGVVLIAMALGAVYELARGERDPVAVASWAAKAYLDQQRTEAPDLATSDADRADAWLASEFGRSVPPVNAPVGYHLVGVSRAGLEGAPGAAVIYASDSPAEAATVMLFVRLSDGPRAAPADVAVEQPLRELSWGADGLDYAVVGPVAEDQLRGFAP
ncbi:MAG: zf-HC2 domain-containing protein [Geminicoccaceae bacterium]